MKVSNYTDPNYKHKCLFELYSTCLWQVKLSSEPLIIKKKLKNTTTKKKNWNITWLVVEAMLKEEEMRGLKAKEETIWDEGRFRLKQCRPWVLKNGMEGLRSYYLIWSLSCELLIVIVLFNGRRVQRRNRVKWSPSKGYSSPLEEVSKQATAHESPSVPIVHPHPLFYFFSQPFHFLFYFKLFCLNSAIRRRD